eukprot:364088-Chlamydomonas_euryale.AAC.9
MPPGMRCACEARRPAFVLQVSHSPGDPGRSWAVQSKGDPEQLAALHTCTHAPSNLPVTRGLRTASHGGKRFKLWSRVWQAVKTGLVCGGRERERQRRPAHARLRLTSAEATPMGLRCKERRLTAHRMDPRQPALEVAKSSSPPVAAGPTSLPEYLQELSQSRVTGSGPAKGMPVWSECNSELHNYKYRN